MNIRLLIALVALSGASALYSMETASTEYRNDDCAKVTSYAFLSPELTRMKLKGCSSMTAEVIGDVLTVCPKLAHVNLTGSQINAEIGAQLFAQKQQLQKLVLKNGKIVVLELRRKNGKTVVVTEEMRKTKKQLKQARKAATTTQA